MAKYIYHFKNEQDFSSRRNGNYYEPWVSLTEPSKRVDYNKTKEEKMPGTRLSFEILSGGTIAWDNGQSSFGTDCSTCYLNYRINGGEWVTLVNNILSYNPEGDWVSAFTVNAGDVVEFRTSGNSVNWDMTQSTDQKHYYFNFKDGLKLNVYGNIMSLIYPEGEFETATEFPHDDDHSYVPTNWFECLFTTMYDGNPSAIIDAGNLLLPATALTNQCYGSMFEGCSTMIAAPKLPAEELKPYCYSGMFRNCRSLNRINAMFTTAPGESYTPGWVENVAPNGTFVKNASATWTETGINGIPAGWTVVTE